MGLLPTGFRAGTVVLLASGRRVLIEQVRPGDVIMATDPTTGRSDAEWVVAAITTVDDTEFTDLTVATPHGPARLTST